MMPRVETFAALEATGVARHGFIGRVPGVDVNVDREAALARLEGVHDAVQESLGLGRLITAEQVHGNQVAVVDRTTLAPVAATDGLLTRDPEVCLGIYVADCGAVFLADPVQRAVGLLHSGRKGTELGISTAAIRRMQEAFGSDPGDLVVQLSPCIRPPHYEIDFAAEIIRQCREAGVKSAHDCGTCTAANVQAYYSYRLEKGKTGRMLALLALKP